METIHHINIAIHVLAGSIALMAGLAALIARKGAFWHIRFGRYFTKAVVIVIVTALFGVLVFKRNNFLLVITLLSAYNCYSGLRALKLRGQKPKYYDYLAPMLVMGAACYYLNYINSIGMYWDATVTFSTIGALFVMTVYDLSKVFLSINFLKRAVMYEHVYKMVSAFIALASAFSGTVFPQYKPYSQVLPSVFGFAYIFVIFIRLANQSTASKTLSYQQQ